MTEISDLEAVGQRIVHEKPMLSAMADFCVAVATAEDPDELAAHDIIFDYIFPNTSTSRSGRSSRLQVALQELQEEPHTPELHQHVHSIRLSELRHLIRSVIQGGEIPVQAFPLTFTHIDQGLYRLGQTKKDVELSHRRAALSVWHGQKDPVTRRRAAEAYRPVGRALRYGYMMGRVAASEKSSSAK